MPDGSAPSRARPRDVRRRSFEPLYREHYTFVWRCLLGLGVRVDTEDAVQEVFATAYRRLHSYEGRGSMRGWLAGIARRVASRWRRTSERRQRRHAAIEPPDDVDDLETWLRRKEAEIFLDSFLEGLDADRRGVFVLCDLEGLRGREAAEALGLNQNTAYARLRSARASFEEACARLEQDGIGIAAAQATRSDEPRQEEVSRGWAVFAVQMGIAGAAKGGAAASIPLLGHLKVAAITVVVGGAGLGAVRLALPDAERDAVATSAVAPQPEAPADPVVEKEVPRSPDVPGVKPQRAAPEVDPTPPVPSVETEPVAAPEPAAPRARKPREKPTPEGLSGDELEQLGRAHRAYAAARYADAVRIAEALLRAHPDSEVAPDARVVLVKAQCGLGRLAAARKAARALAPAEAENLLVTHCEQRK